MSVAGILSSSLFNYSIQSAQSKLQQSRQVFQQLGQDLQSGNLPAAQTDFAALQPSGSSSSVLRFSRALIPSPRASSNFRRTFSPGMFRLRSRTMRRFSRTSRIKLWQSTAIITTLAAGVRPAGSASCWSSWARNCSRVTSTPPSRRTAHCSRISRNLPRATGPCSHRQRQLRARSR